MKKNHFLVALSLIAITCDAQDSSTYKLIVDNGKYRESEWSRQLAITNDDKLLIVSDFSSGIKLYEIETGELVNMFEGHSLEGDLFFDSKAKVLVTTGDRKIKIWDIAKQKLLKQINQGFHSQFMNNVYIDSKRKFVFAENVKYDYNTGTAIKKYSYPNMYFFKDAYYTFNQETGLVSQYGVYDDLLKKSFKIYRYRKGNCVFFNENKGYLFIGFTNGVQAVDISTGDEQLISFDRSTSFSNLGINSNFDFSNNKKYFIATTNQGKDLRFGGDGNLVVLKYDSLSNLYKEIYRDSLEKTNEILALNNSNRIVITRVSKIEFLDLDSLDMNKRGLIWSKEENLVDISRISRNDANIYKVQYGSKVIHLVDVVHALAGDYNEDNVLKYFDLVDNASIRGQSGWCNFKPGTKLSDLPEALHPLWRKRKQYFFIDLMNEGFKPVINAKYDDNTYVESSSYSSRGTVEGENYSPGKNYYAIEESFKGVSFYNKARVRLLTGPTSGVIYHIEYSKDEAFAAFGGSDRKITVVDLKNKRKIHVLAGNSYITSICFSNENKYVFSGSLKNEILMHDMSTGKLVRKFTGSNGSITDLEVSSEGKFLISVAEDNSLRFWDIQTGSLLVTAYFDYEHNYLAFTPDGFFDKSEKFKGKVDFNVDGTLISFSQLYEKFYRPDILKTVFRGGVVNETGKIKISNGIMPPPIVYLEVKNTGGSRGLVIEEGEDKGAVEIMVKAQDNGGGISGLRLFHSGKLVAERIIEKTIKTDTALLTASIELVAGENVLSAIGISDDNTESRPVIKRIISNKKRIQKPDLYILSIGINDYKNSKYNLNYCTSDMQSFSDAVGLVGKNLFNNISVTLIGNNEATKTNVINHLKELATKIKPADVFVLFYAGHGIALEKTSVNLESNFDFFYVLYGVTQMTDLNNCASNGLSGVEMRGLLTNLKANKQILFLDACNSGAFLEQFAIRGAAEENALAKLSRSTGSAIFASTTKDQFATESSELKHGVFTFVLMEALNGGASTGNCQITVASLKNFIDDQIPFYTEKYKGKAQYSTTFMFGQDFPIGVKCK